jgi:hypothetical protein
MLLKMTAAPSTLRSRFPSALALAVLAALAASPRAAAAERARAAVEDLSRGAARPDDFKRVLEGSPERRGDVDVPGAFTRREGRARAEAPRLSRPEPGLRPEGAVVPPSAVLLAGRADAPRREDWTPDLKTREIAAVLGLGLLLIAGSWLETPRELETVGGEAPEAPSPARSPSPEPFRPTAPALEPTRFAEAPAERDFIDTRMPAPTWRAISWREQSLIDAWDASPEKSAGLASLPEWLDARGAAAGVNVPLLKAKLFREA